MSQQVERKRRLRSLDEFEPPPWHASRRREAFPWLLLVGLMLMALGAGWLLG